MAATRHVNMYGGSPLNRLSWLRPSQIFLNAVVKIPTTRWLVFKSGEPLSASNEPPTGKPELAYLNTDDVKPFLGSEPFFGQGEAVGELITEKDEADDSVHHSPTQGARHLGVRVVFLGLHETNTGHNGTALPSSELSDPKKAMDKLQGTPYFAVDIQDLEDSPEKIQEILNQTSLAKEGKVLRWAEPRGLIASADIVTAGIFASARSMVDWNQRNKFCAGCGSPTYSMWGGWKVACKSLLPWADNTNRKPCPTVKGLHNFTHPRTDAVVIMIAIDETGDKILLGRGRKYPGNFYSALAGFIEPGESFEDAVAREMWEEAGVHVWDVTYHSTQPWPYPANLMAGFYARADSTKPIRTDLDNELVDARWFTREQVEEVIGHSTGTKFGKSDYKKMAEIIDGPKKDSVPDVWTSSTTTQPKTQGDTVSAEPPFRLPPTSAIAGVLIRDWVDRKAGVLVGDNMIQKGNL